MRSLVFRISCLVLTQQPPEQPDINEHLFDHKTRPQTRYVGAVEILPIGGDDLTRLTLASEQLVGINDLCVSYVMF